MISEKSVRSLDNVRASNIPSAAVLCGGGETLEDDISRIRESDYIVAADGATTALLEAMLLPDVIVTDLDGRVEDQIDANARGSTVFVHAHGDNVAALRRWVDRFEGRVVGTCQGPPVPGVFNFGGFTDGDRAACIMHELGVRRMSLAGFDLERPSEKPGGSQMVKSRKLRWAERILSRLAEYGVEFTSVAH